MEKQRDYSKNLYKIITFVKNKIKLKFYKGDFFMEFKNKNMKGYQEIEDDKN